MMVLITLPEFALSYLGKKIVDISLGKFQIGPVIANTNAECAMRADDQQHEQQQPPSVVKKLDDLAPYLHEFQSSPSVECDARFTATGSTAVASARCPTLIAGWSGFIYDVGTEGISPRRRAAISSIS